MAKIFVINDCESASTGNGLPSDDCSHVNEDDKLEEEITISSDLKRYFSKKGTPVLQMSHNILKNKKVHILQRKSNAGNKVTPIKPLASDACNEMKKAWNSDKSGQNDLIPSLLFEKTLAEEKFARQKEIFSSIINNDSNNLSMANGILYALGITLMGIVPALPLAIIPFHDLAQFPEFWFEILLQGVFNITWGWAQYCFAVSNWLNISRIKTPSNILIMCLAGNIAQAVVVIIVNYIWTDILHYDYPIPFFLTVITLSFLLLWDSIVWFRFPKDWRDSNEFRRRMRYVIFTVISFIIYCMMNAVIIQLLQDNQSQYQAIMALSLPAIREIFSWICTKFMDKTSNGNSTGAKIVLKYCFALQYSLVLCLSFGSFATDVTSWVLLAIDYSLNIALCLQIVRMKRQNHGFENPVELIQDLTVNELVELCVPLSYMLVFLLVHLGPNACLFTTMYSSCNDMEKMVEVLTNIFFYCSIDFSSCLVSAIILWFSCKINLWKVFTALQQEYGLEFAIALGNTMIVVWKKR